MNPVRLLGTRTLDPDAVRVFFSRGVQVLCDPLPGGAIQ